MAYVEIALDDPKQLDWLTCSPYRAMTGFHVITATAARHLIALCKLSLADHETVVTRLQDKYFLESNLHKHDADKAEDCAASCQLTPRCWLFRPGRVGR